MLPDAPGCSWMLLDLLSSLIPPSQPGKLSVAPIETRDYGNASILTGLIPQMGIWNSCIPDIPARGWGCPSCAPGALPGEALELLIKKGFWWRNFEPFFIGFPQYFVSSPRILSLGMSGAFLAPARFL